LLDTNHYLGAPNPVGERLWYAALSPDGRWLAVLLFVLPGHQPPDRRTAAGSMARGQLHLL
jgi:hypothetical protein